MTRGTKISRVSFAQTISWKVSRDFGDQKHHDFWLADQWRILDITTSEMTVMNLCGQEETLNVREMGSVKGEAGVATAPSRSSAPATSEALPPHRVEVYPGMLGKTHEIRYDAECNVVHFKPIDQAKPALIYRWNAMQGEFVEENDPTNTRTPGQLERMAGIVLKEFRDKEWQGKNCGDYPRWVL